MPGKLTFPKIDVDRWSWLVFVSRMVACLIALTPLMQIPKLLAQDADCKDTFHAELHMAQGGSAKHAEAREFLWRHWSDRRCGELFLKAWTREGVRTDSHYKIEATHSQKMMLSVTLSRTDDPSAPVDGLAVPSSGTVSVATPPETVSYQAYTVERVKPDVPYFIDKAKRISDNKAMTPLKYLLRFRDKDGKVITDF